MALSNFVAYDCARNSSQEKKERIVMGSDC